MIFVPHKKYQKTEGIFCMGAQTHRHFTIYFFNPCFLVIFDFTLQGTSAVCQKRKYSVNVSPSSNIWLLSLLPITRLLRLFTDIAAAPSTQFNHPPLHLFLNTSALLTLPSNLLLSLIPLYSHEWTTIKKS